MLATVRKICDAVLRISAFAVLLSVEKSVFSPLFTELYMLTPFVFFCAAAGFFSLFLIRETACLVFLPKARLRGILRDGEIDPPPSKYFLRAFGAPFLKRVFFYLFLFAAETVFRLLSIRLYLNLMGGAVPFLERLANLSAAWPFAASLTAGFLIMELPCYELFYKYSFRDRLNRSHEYRFGLKVFAYLLLLYVVSLFLTYACLKTGIVDLSTRTGAVAFFGLLAPFGCLLWAAMYVRDPRRVLKQRLSAVLSRRNGSRDGGKNAGFDKNI